MTDFRGWALKFFTLDSTLLPLIPTLVYGSVFVAVFSSDSFGHSQQKFKLYLEEKKKPITVRTY